MLILILTAARWRQLRKGWDFQKRRRRSWRSSEQLGNYQYCRDRQPRLLSRPIARATHIGRNRLVFCWPSFRPAEPPCWADLRAGRRGGDFLFGQLVGCGMFSWRCDGFDRAEPAPSLV